MAENRDWRGLHCTNFIQTAEAIGFIDRKPYFKGRKIFAE